MTGQCVTCVYTNYILKLVYRRRIANFVLTTLLSQRIKNRIPNTNVGELIECLYFLKHLFNIIICSNKQCEQ